MSQRILKVAAAVLFCATLLPATAAASIIDPVVEDNRISLRIDLGSAATELTIEFENVVGLSLDNIGVTAEPVNLADPALLTRLVGSNISLAGGLPVLVKVQPPASGALSFEGVVTIEFYTHDLHYTAGTPLRLFSAPDGGTFRDITASMSSGSYRVRGSKGNFSEFLIVADLRAITTVVNSKFNRLASLLQQHGASIDSSTYNALEADLTAAQAAWNTGNIVQAIAKVESFASRVRAADYSEIPDVWRSSRDLDNVAGELRAAAATLRFSLTLASNSL